MPGPVGVFMGGCRVVGGRFGELVELREHDQVSRRAVRGPVATMANVSTDGSEERLGRGDPLGSVPLDRSGTLPAVNLAGRKDREDARDQSRLSGLSVLDGTPLDAAGCLLATPDLASKLAPLFVRGPVAGPLVGDGDHPEHQMVPSPVRLPGQRVDRLPGLGDGVPRHPPCAYSSFDLRHYLGGHGRVQLIPIHGAKPSWVTARSEGPISGRAYLICQVPLGHNGAA